MAEAIQRSIGIGIDFGTSNSVAALYDGSRVHIVDFGGGRRSLPSACYLDTNLLAVTGQEALDAYIDDNVGRRVELAAVPIGYARTSTGSYDEFGLPQLAQGHIIFSAAQFDVNLPGRLFYGTKQMLATSEDGVLPVFGKSFRLEALITPILLRIREAVTAQLAALNPAEAADHAVIGRPVHFERGGDGGDARAEKRLRLAYTHAGFSDHEPCYEPVAAALNYLHSQQDHAAPGTLLTVDFGGGTLDFCVFRGGDAGFQVLGTHGLALGGNHIDQLLFRKLLFPLLGEGISGRFFTADGYIDSHFAFSEYAELLLNWPVSYLLNQNRYLTPIREMVQHGGAEAPKFRRLLDLIQFNYSYLVLQHIRDFKESFAAQDHATLDVPELDISLTLTRQEFDALIEPATTQFTQALDATLEQTGIATGEIDRVICVGGSTQLGAIRAALDARFPGRTVAHDIFTSVAAGLAIKDWQRRNQAATTSRSTSG